MTSQACRLTLTITGTAEPSRNSKNLFKNSINLLILCKFQYFSIDFGGGCPNDSDSRLAGPPSTLFCIRNPENAARTHCGIIEKDYDSQAQPLR